MVHDLVRGAGRQSLGILFSDSFSSGIPPLFSEFTDPQFFFFFLFFSPERLQLSPCVPSLLYVPWTAISLRLKDLRDMEFAISHPPSESILFTRVFLHLFILLYLQGGKSGLSLEFSSLTELL